MAIRRNFKQASGFACNQQGFTECPAGGEEFKVPLPLTGIVQGLLMSLMNEGKGDYDTPASSPAIEKMAGIEIAKPA